jgi:hypothetical protein
VDEQWDLGYDQTKERSKNETTYGKGKAAKKTEKSQIYRQLNKRVKKEVRWDKRRWIDNQAKKAEAAAKKGYMKELYDTMQGLTN